MATTAVSHPSTTATLAVSQTPTMGTTAVSLQTTATSIVSQSTMGHITVSPSVGDAFQSTSSLLAAASELEAAIDQALPGGIATTPQDRVTGNVPNQDPTSNPQGSAKTATSAAQQLTATTTDNNQLQVIAQVHAEDKASQSADSANPVLGLKVMSAEEIEAITDSGMAPKPNLGTALVDIMVGHQLSTLLLGKELGSVPAPGTGQLTVGPGTGSSPGTGDVPPPVTDQQGQTSAEPQHPSAIMHTGINPDATQSANSTQQGFESAATTFHSHIEPPKTLIPGAQPAGPEFEAEMLEDGDRQGQTTMDSGDTPTDAQDPSTSANQQPGNLGATGQPGPAISFTPDVMADLLKAASAGHFWDDPGPLKGATAAQMQEMQAVLQKMASNQKPAETDPDKDESGLDRVVIRVHRSSESPSTSAVSSLESS